MVTKKIPKIYPIASTDTFASLEDLASQRPRLVELQEKIDKAQRKLEISRACEAILMIEKAFVECPMLDFFTFNLIEDEDQPNRERISAQAFVLSSYPNGEIVSPTYPRDRPMSLSVFLHGLSPKITDAERNALMDCGGEVIMTAPALADASGGFMVNAPELRTSNGLRITRGDACHIATLFKAPEIAVAMEARRIEMSAGPGKLAGPMAKRI